jgi:hypothetical protein
MSITATVHVDPNGKPLRIEFSNGCFNDGVFGYALVLDKANAAAESDSSITIPAGTKAFGVDLTTPATNLDGAHLGVWGTVGLSAPTDGYNATVVIRQTSAGLATFAHQRDANASAGAGETVTGSTMRFSDCVALTTKSAPAAASPLASSLAAASTTAPPTPK